MNNSGGRVKVDVLKIILTIVLIAACVIGVIVILMQEGKQNGLGSLSGTVDNSYWQKNKGRSMEGNLVKITTFLTALFIIIPAVLCMGIFQ